VSVSNLQPVTAPPADSQTWHRLSPLSPLVRAGRGLVPVVALFATAGLDSHSRRHVSWNLVLDGALLLLALGLGLVSWLVTRWQIADGALCIETGLLRRSSLRFPLAQLQSIDVVSSAFARVLGLAELRLRMAGTGHGRNSRLAYLPAAQTMALRARLLALAHGMDESVPEPPERLLVLLPTPRLIASIVLSRSGLLTVALIAGIAGLATQNPDAAAAVVSAGAAALIAILTGFWRRFNGSYGLQVAEAGDGFRLRSGLVQTTAETIPVHRVQAVRLTEPLLWRPFGWCRVEVAVAGGRRSRDEDAEGRRLRAVLPVGGRAEAAMLLQRLVPGAPIGRRRAPGRARWKSPLSYHNLSWDGDARYVVATNGRIRRSVHWVPLAKVQSIRLVQGPVQRMLRLGSVHLDTAGRSVHAELTDRGMDEIATVLAELPARCRAARLL
jgi:putative membrane protein